MTSGFCRLTLAAVLLVLTACGGPDPTTPPDDPLHPSAVCGDGTKASSEACDDGNTTPGDGCNATCAAVETGYACETAGRACVRLTCGDGRKTGSEVCDDGNGQSLDGCALDCSEVEAHYTCATPGQPCTVEPGWTCTGGSCRAAACGDGLKVGDEECEDGNAGSGDGCSAACRLESGYKCPTVGQPCEHTVCGDGVPEGTEQCDDGDNDMGDGCSPLCVNEPRCSGGTCTAVCGDNVILPGAPADECDDGNTRSGDGCSADCKLEPDSGFQCTTIEQAPPDTVELPVVYRDFVAVGLQAGSVPTHPDFNDANGAETGIVGALYTGALSADGKPTYAKEGLTSATTHGKARFDQWYRDVPGVNLTRVSTLSLARQSSGAYLFDDQTFFPLDGLGWVAEGAENTAQNSDTGAQAPRNFGFTSEARYWFEFKGTEKLDFRGDDDVWVYINGRLALDLGGVHGAADGTVDLSSTTVATNLGLVRGRIYEVVVFQAERHVTRSSYKLTLNNFVTRRTECVNLCGNGTVEGSEQCDAGRANNTGGYGHCSPTCTQGPRCGDGVTQSQFGEQCDDANTVDNDSCNNLCRVSIG